MVRSTGLIKDVPIAIYILNHCHDNIGGTRLRIHAGESLHPGPLLAKQDSQSGTKSRWHFLNDTAIQRCM